ncbi:MAG: hypothetical protein KF799_11035 [Bdellovibrionales bacterium]|nr:hypothetical protein [Bdellovibrionales bacterium]
MFKISTFILCCTLFGFGRVMADEIEGLDAEVEETMAESEATSQQSKYMRERAMKEREEAVTEQRRAQEKRAEAESKRRSAQAEVLRQEKEITRLQGERAKHQKDRAVAEREIAKQEKLQQVSTAKLNKVKGEVEALRGLREEQRQKLSQLKQQNQDLSLQTVRAQTDFNEKKAEFTRAQGQLKVNQQKLNQTQKENSRKKLELQKQMEKLKSDYRTVKERNAAVAADVQRQNAENAKLQSQVKYGQSELNNARARGQQQRRMPASKAKRPAGY